MAFKLDIKLSQASRAVALLLLLVGVIFNVITFIHFKIATSKRLEDIVMSIEVSSLKLYDDVLRRVDERLEVISTNGVSSSVSSSVDITREKKDSPLLPVIDSIDYDYYVSNGRHIARIRNQDFSDGSPYPRGGVITRVYADCLVIDGKYTVSRSSSSSGLSRSSAAASVSSSSFDFSEQKKKLQEI